MSDEPKHPREPEQTPGVRAGKLVTQRDPVKAALFRDALASARTLKRNHSDYYSSDRKGFRALVKKAHARVFRLKPGPTADPRIAEAARHRAAGAKWPDLYAKHIPDYTHMSEYTKDLAEAGFQHWGHQSSRSLRFLLKTAQAG